MKGREKRRYEAKGRGWGGVSCKGKGWLKIIRIIQGRQMNQRVLMRKRGGWDKFPSLLCGEEEVPSSMCVRWGHRREIKR